MQTAICPGSYDPVTKGHVHIIERSARLFPKVRAVVMHNPAKTAAFTPEERVWMLRLATRHLPNVEVDACGGLAADYARRCGAAVLVKGLRALADFEYEFQMAGVNRGLNPDLETLFIGADPRFAYCSSSAVRELARHGAPIDDFVPGAIAEVVKRRFSPQHRPGPPLQVVGGGGAAAAGQAQPASVQD